MITAAGSLKSLYSSDEADVNKVILRFGISDSVLENVHHRLRPCGTTFHVFKSLYNAGVKKPYEALCIDLKTQDILCKCRSCLTVMPPRTRLNSRFLVSNVH